MPCSADVSSSTGKRFCTLVGDHSARGEWSDKLCPAAGRHRGAEDAPRSAVSPTHESLLTAYGTVGGRLVGGERPLYQLRPCWKNPPHRGGTPVAWFPGCGQATTFVFRHARAAPEIFDLLTEQAPPPAAAQSAFPCFATRWAADAAIWPSTSPAGATTSGRRSACCRPARG